MTASGDIDLFDLPREARHARAERIASLLARAIGRLVARARTGLRVLDRLVHLEQKRRACLCDLTLTPRKRASRDLQLRLGKWELFWDCVLPKREREGASAKISFKTVRTKRIIARSRRHRRYRARHGLA